MDSSFAGSSNVIQTIDMKNIDVATLDALGQAKVLELLVFLRDENDRLKSVSEVETKRYDERLAAIEKELNLDRQYHRRDTIEISGMPEDIEPEDVEDEVLKVMKAANVKVDGKHVRKIDIQAAHYKRNKNVIVKFVNRKFAEAAIANGNQLKDKRLFDNDKNIYVNNSFCREFAFINYAVRQAKKKGEISLY